MQIYKEINSIHSRLNRLIFTCLKICYVLDCGFPRTLTICWCIENSYNIEVWFTRSWMENPPTSLEICACVGKEIWEINVIENPRIIQRPASVGLQRSSRKELYSSIASLWSAALLYNKMEFPPSEYDVLTPASSRTRGREEQGTTWWRSCCKCGRTGGAWIISGWRWPARSSRPRWRRPTSDPQQWTCGKTLEFTVLYGTGA